MEQIKDQSAFNWIREHRLRGPSAPQQAPGTHWIFTVFPRDSFAAYCKVFNPIYEDLSIEDKQITWNDEQLAELMQPDPSRSKEEAERTLRASSQWKIRAGYPPGPFPSHRILWRALAQRYGIPFNAEIEEEPFLRIFGWSWPRYLIAPEAGTLDERTKEHIVRVLEPLTGKQLCYFCNEFPFERDIELYRGRLEEVLNADNDPEKTVSPTYWWPEDHTWCVYTDYDGTSSFIAGSTELIGALDGDSFLEVLRIACGDEAHSTGGESNGGQKALTDT